MENVILSKQAFAEEICNKLNEMYEGGGYSFTLQEVEKNNDVKILAVCVKPDDGNVAANCYVEASYKDYLKKPDLKESIIEDFCTATMRNLKIPSFDIESIMNKDYVRANVIPVLVNKDNNKNSLNSLVSGERSDLAIIYKIQVQNDMLMGNGSIKVKPEHLTYLGMTQAELHEAAMSNLSKQGFNIKSMESFLFRMMSDDNSAALSESQGIDLSKLKNTNMPLFVITNNSLCDGANVLLQEDKLKEIGDALGFDYVIIPSSIHEVLLVTEENLDNIETYNQMVREVNATQVTKEERLSDHVYVYSVDAGKLLTDTEYQALSEGEDIDHFKGIS